MAVDAPSLIFVALKLIPGALTCSHRSAPSTLPKSPVVPDLCSQQVVPGKRLNPLWEEMLSQQSFMLIFTHHLLLLEVRPQGNSPPQVIPSGTSANSQGLHISISSLKPGMSMGLTVFCAEEPEQLLQLFLIDAQHKGRVAHRVVVCICAGKGGKEVPVVLCLGCGGKEQES